MLSWIKHIIKKYFQILWTRHKFSPAVQIAQRQLINFYQTLPAHTQTNKFLPIKETGYNVFSQFEEDGKLIYILSKIGVKHELFIDIGSDDGINSNCANLALNLQWSGLFIDANPRSIARGDKENIKSSAFRGAHPAVQWRQHARYPFHPRERGPHQGGRLEEAYRGRHRPLAPGGR